MKRQMLLTGLVAVLALAGTQTAKAQGGDAILDMLTKKGVITQKEANDVRSQMDTQTAQAVELHNKGKFSSWLDSVTFSGDFRLRAEDFMFEDYRNTTDRLRFRYRLRLGMDFQYQDWAKVTLRLASGEAAPGDPVSTNQSMTDTFKKKPLTIDAAYVTIQPPGWNWIKVMGGKMDIPTWQPKFNSPMVYDFDVTPEGVAEQLQYVFGDKQQYRVFGEFGQYILKEISSNNSREPYVVDLQAGIEAKFGGDYAKNPKLKTTVAGGYFFTHNLKNTGYAFGDSPNTGNANGSGSSTNNYFADFSVLYGRGEIAYELSSKPFLGTPSLLTLCGEVDFNMKNAYENLTSSGQTLDKDQRLGWTAQLAFGNAKKKGEWQVAYQYKYMQADAVWDALTDSDWGTGGTDRQGHVVKGTYCFADWWQMNCTMFITHKISDRANSGHNTVGAIGANHGQDMMRLQVDSVFKF
jgi:hypothetical protein